MKLRPSYLIFIHDAVMAAISFLLSVYLRLGDEFAQSELYLRPGILIFTGVCLAVFARLRLYRMIWRYTSLHDLITVLKAVLLSIALFLPVMFLFTRLEGVPRSLLFINAMVLLLLLAGPRVLYRIHKEKNFTLSQVFSGGRRIPVILAGVNNNAELFLREMARSNAPFEVVAIVDEDNRKNGNYLYNVKILGDYKAVPKVVEKLKAKNICPEKIIFTADHEEGSVIRSMLTVADTLGMTVARLPKLTEFQNTDGERRLDVKPVVIEDLLGRAQNALSRDAMRALITGKRVLITGCGGTIGGELTRQIAGYGPAQLTLLELSEFNLYTIDKECEEAFPHIARKALIGDVRSCAFLERVFEEYQPELVFHAAALKHVPIVEENIHEAVLTNAIGSRNIADCCVAYKVKAMVMISTDKAVNPTNIMGCTKRIAESYVQALGQSGKGGTSFITVRFGNVLGSSGSVIPLFQRQIAKGGPLTVTHPDIERYFMTVREAVELVLQASVMGMGWQDKRSNIFVLDMGDPIKINDLAIQMIKMAGLRPHTDIAICYTGLRPGEKLYEELFHDAEAPYPTEHKGILLANPRQVALEDITRQMQILEQKAQAGEDAAIFSLIKEIVPEYQVLEDEKTK